MFRRHNHCRACGLGKPALPTLKTVTGDATNQAPTKLLEVLDLGVSPLANDFSDMAGDHAGYAPLKLMWCPRCSLGQLSVVVDPQVIYSVYPYVTSHSDTMMKHFDKLLDDLLKEVNPGTVVEIGSNDGTFLKRCTEGGFGKAIGIEPASNLCDIANKHGITTYKRFFNELIARELNLEGVAPDLIVARHVFCHIDDWQETIHALGVLSAKHTLVAIEVPYFVETVKNVEWDQIYHEHLSYMTIKAMEWALKGSMFHIHAVKHYTIHGGAIVIMLRRNDCEIPAQPLPEEALIQNDLLAFRDKAEGLVLDLRETVAKLVNDGKTVVGYGASAKATQWIQACGFTRKHLKFVCDNTAQKLWKLMPGTDIPVVDSGALTRELPDVAIMFCWNFSVEVIEKENYFRNNGGKWVIPVPNVHIV